MDKKKAIFLLGGYDLEMIEIKKMLENSSCTVYDKELSWGAKLSAYEDEIRNNSDKIIYGIELENDIKVRNTYVEIDHHNENSYKSSALEQIAHLLDIPLTREQQLICANDTGYIPALKKMGASQDEINAIRRMDRQFQGVTEEDEQKAEASIRNKYSQEGVIVVHALTERFSPITDRLYPCEKLIIYTENELNYYGKNAAQIAKKLHSSLSEHNLYAGGGPDGYFGIVKAGIDKKGLHTLLKEIISYAGEK